MSIYRLQWTDKRVESKAHMSCINSSERVELFLRAQGGREVDFFLQYPDLPSKNQMALSMEVSGMSVARPCFLFMNSEMLGQGGLHPSIV